MISSRFITYTLLIDYESLLGDFKIEVEVEDYYKYYFSREEEVLISSEMGIISVKNKLTDKELPINYFSFTDLEDIVFDFIQDNESNLSEGMSLPVKDNISITVLGVDGPREPTYEVDPI